MRFSKPCGPGSGQKLCKCGQRASRQAATLPGLLNRELAVDKQTRKKRSSLWKNHIFR